MEDFSKVFTVEVKTEKGWEVGNICEEGKHALLTFERYVWAGIECRVTSPEVSVLQERMHKNG